MVKRRALAKKDLDHSKFEVLVRYMIIAAENKNLVTYTELSKVFGIPIEDLSYYAGILGDYCDVNGKYYLNSLIINSTNGMPGEDFFIWGEFDKSDWGEVVAECFAKYHVPLVKRKVYSHSAGVQKKINEFLNS